jgi:hypothetical protein
MGRLDVRIVEARNLPNTELIGKPDPYVVVQVEQSSHKTSVASSTTNPKWDEVFKFVVADPDSCQLELKLWNKNMVSDDFMGLYKMNLSGLERGVVKDQWILLQQCKTNAEIHVRIMAHDFGRTPAPGQAAQVIQQQPVVMQQPVYQQPMVQQPVVMQQPVYQQQPMMMQQPVYQQPVMMAQPMMGQPMMMAQPMMGQPMMGGYPQQQGYPQPGYPQAQPGYPGQYQQHHHHHHGHGHHHY